MRQKQDGQVVIAGQVPAEVNEKSNEGPIKISLIMQEPTGWHFLKKNEPKQRKTLWRRFSGVYTCIDLSSDGKAGEKVLVTEYWGA